MGSSNQIKDAIAVLTANPEDSLKIIDEEIANLQAEIEQLRNARRLLAPKPQRPAKSDQGMTAEMEADEEQIFALLTKKAGTQMKPGEIAAKLKIPFTRVGKIVARSKCLAKHGVFVIAKE